jgi:hypothetical protein
LPELLDTDGQAHDIVVVRAVRTGVESGMSNTPVPVRETAAGIGVVPIEVFADPTTSVNNCVPIRVAVGDEQAVPVVVMSGSLDGEMMMMMASARGAFTGMASGVRRRWKSRQSAGWIIKIFTTIWRRDHERRVS